MRPVETVIGKYVELEPNPVHVELGYRITYLRGICPFCDSNGFTVLLEEQEWVCRACQERGDALKFLEMLIARRRSDPAPVRTTFDVSDSRIPGRPPRPR